MSSQVTRDEIRRMVRELLHDAVASAPDDDRERAGAAAGQTASGKPEQVGGLSERVRAALTGGGGAIEVAVANDADLNGFARQVALCALERDLLGAIAANRVRFRLAGSVVPSAPAATTPAVTSPAAPAGASPRDGEAFHWEQGLLNEAKVTEIARTHARLVLGRRALLTPLAWDRARSLGLQVTRVRP